MPSVQFLGSMCAQDDLGTEERTGKMGFVGAFCLGWMRREFSQEGMNVISYETCMNHDWEWANSEVMPASRPLCSNVQGAAVYSSLVES